MVKGFRENPRLYEINTVPWLLELSRKRGGRVTLGAVPQEEWQRIRSRGMDFAWLMGVWRRSERGRQIYMNDPTTPANLEKILPDWNETDILGSAYSIGAYEPDPLVGNWEDIDIARAKLNRLGMGLVLDFVPNQTGPDHPWVFQYPEYYIQGSLGDFKQKPADFFAFTRPGGRNYLAKAKDPNFGPWSDTLQINFFNKDARQAVLDELLKIAPHCDGLRCDMAMLMLNDIFARTWHNLLKEKKPAAEFWTEAIKRAPDLVWLAETYWETEKTLLELGFDYCYDKTLYDRLRWSPAYDIYFYLSRRQAYGNRLARFTENHDEPRAVEAFGRERSLAAATLTATVPGLKIYHDGQFAGKKIRIPVQVRRTREEMPDCELEQYYDKLLKITDRSIYSTGTWKLKNVLPVGPDNSFRNILAYLWQYADEMKLIVINFGRDMSQGRVSLECDLLDGCDFALLDELNDQTYIRHGPQMLHPGLHVILGGYRAHVFDIKPV